MARILGEIVGLSLAVIFLGTFFVVGVTTLAEANVTSLSSTQVVIWGILGLVAILAAVIGLLKYVGVEV